MTVVNPWQKSPRVYHADHPVSLSSFRDFYIVRTSRSALYIDAEKQPLEMYYLDRKYEMAVLLDRDA